MTRQETMLNLSEPGAQRFRLFGREEIEAAMNRALEHQRGNERLPEALRRLAGKSIPDAWECLAVPTPLAALDLLLRDKHWTGDAAGALPGEPKALELMRLHGLDAESFGDVGRLGDSSAVRMEAARMLYLEQAGWESAGGAEAREAGAMEPLAVPSGCRLAVVRLPDCRWGAQGRAWTDGEDGWRLLGAGGPKLAFGTGPDRTEVAAIGSLSTGMPGVETAWIAAEPQMIRRLAGLQRASGTAGLLGGRIMEELLEIGSLSERIKEAAAGWDAALQHLEAALRTTMAPSVGWRRAARAGELSLLLPEGLGLAALAKAARLKGISFSGGSIQGRGRPRAVVTISCEAGSGEARLEHGVRLLGETIGEFQARS
ncbi:MULTISPECIES: hypothetical protein [unclassified Paenibacillus]|uniref:hypothetical protein n=1 Tax=unclassified Paenibacillus TaxID=185978 RepID=UPI0011155190|nr:MULTISPECIES: hypothetical protein [unclassified Paenibacillus]ASS66601.2 hypothetical protein CIC07_10825 [Paenibacillus sp. RUD330]